MNGRNPDVLLRKTVIRKSKYYLLHVRSELPNPARERVIRKSNDSVSHVRREHFARREPPTPGHVAAAKGDGVRNNGGDGTPRQRMGWDSATTERMGLSNCVIHNGYGYEGDDGEDDE